MKQARSIEFLDRKHDLTVRVHQRRYNETIPHNVMFVDKLSYEYYQNRTVLYVEMEKGADKFYYEYSGRYLICGDGWGSSDGISL